MKNHVTLKTGVLSFINNIKVYTVYHQFSAHKFHINESVTKIMHDLPGMN